MLWRSTLGCLEVMGKWTTRGWYMRKSQSSTRMIVILFTDATITCEPQFTTGRSNGNNSVAHCLLFFPKMLDDQYVRDYNQDARKQAIRIFEETE